MTMKKKKRNIRPLLFLDIITNLIAITIVLLNIITGGDYNFAVAVSLIVMVVIKLSIIIIEYIDNRK